MQQKATKRSRKSRKSIWATWHFGTSVIIKTLSELYDYFTSWMLKVEQCATGKDQSFKNKRYKVVFSVIFLHLIHENHRFHSFYLPSKSNCQLIANTAASVDPGLIKKSQQPA